MCNRFDINFFSFQHKKTLLAKLGAFLILYYFSENVSITDPVN